MRFKNAGYVNGTGYVDTLRDLKCEVCKVAFGKHNGEDCPESALERRKVKLIKKLKALGYPAPAPASESVYIEAGEVREYSGVVYAVIESPTPEVVGKKLYFKKEP